MNDRRDARDARNAVTEEDLRLAGFFVGTGLYGIEIMRIKEVIQAKPHPIRPVPYAPAIVEGVIQLRGVVIPVVDLRRRFAVPVDPAIEHLNKLIIVSVAGRIAGLKVDRVLGELRVSAGSLRPAPSMLRPDGERGPEANIFSGVSRVEVELPGQRRRSEQQEKPSRGRVSEPSDRASSEDRGHMVFVINLDALLRTGGK